MSRMRAGLRRLLDGEDLIAGDTEVIFDELMSGDAPPELIAGWAIALRARGETAAELSGAARSMRAHAAYIDAGARRVVDTCGTGGDGGNTFNISTAAALVAAGAGAPVAKHGNRAVSSRCGSADVLAELGVRIDAEPALMEECLQEHGIGFLYAPLMHPAMKAAAGPRKALGVRTIFNMLGPLTNPAGATGQVLGVYAPQLTEMFATALRELGARRALVVHGEDGLDEITCCGETRVSELRDGRVRTYTLSAEQWLGELYDCREIAGGDPPCNAAILRDVLRGRAGAPRAVTLLNSAAALIAGECADEMGAALQMAREAIDSGAALEKLRLLAEYTSGSGGA